jgi:excisionase family DNA binding protein
MTIGDVAELLGVSQRTIRRWIDDGRLKAIQLGGRRAPVRLILTSSSRGCGMRASCESALPGSASAAAGV